MSGNSVLIVPPGISPSARNPPPIPSPLVRHGSVLTDRQIKGLCDPAHVKAPMIAPFTPHQVRVDENERKIMSYGLSSMGYDVTLDTEFKIFTNINSTVIDPLNMTDDCYVDFKGEVCIIPPKGYALGVTKEYFRVPKDVIITCLGKSTYARAGLIINVTPIEPGFEGTVVIEFYNATPLPMKVYANMGVAQFLFFQATEDCEVGYGDRNGKYQGQTGLVTARV